MTRDEMREQAATHFERIKTSPVDGDLNHFRFIDMSDRQTLGGDVLFYPKGFDKPQMYYEGQWVDLDKDKQKLILNLKDSGTSEEL